MNRIFSEILHNRVFHEHTTLIQHDSLKLDRSNNFRAKLTRYLNSLISGLACVYMYVYDGAFHWFIYRMFKKKKKIDVVNIQITNVLFLIFSFRDRGFLGLHCYTLKNQRHRVKLCKTIPWFHVRPYLNVFINMFTFSLTIKMFNIPLRTWSCKSDNLTRLGNSNISNRCIRDLLDVIIWFGGLTFYPQWYGRWC